MRKHGFFASFFSWKEKKEGRLLNNHQSNNTPNAQAWWLLKPALFYVVFSPNKIALSGRGSSVGGAGGNHPFRSNFRGEKIPTPQGRET